MITLDDILSVLVPSFKKQPKLSVKSCDVIQSFELREGKEDLTDCILEHMNVKKTTLIDFLTNTNINKNVNRKKMVYLLKHSQTNNELLLFLSGYLDCNIWVFYASNNIFKVYYMEEHYQEYKKDVYVLNMIRDNSVQTLYHIGEPKEDVRGYIRENYITVPIGLKENKVWKTGEVEGNALYEDLNEGDNEYVTECPLDPYQCAVFNMKHLINQIT